MKRRTDIVECSKNFSSFPSEAKQVCLKSFETRWCTLDSECIKVFQSGTRRNPCLLVFQFTRRRRDLVSRLTLFTSPLSASRQTSRVVSNFSVPIGRKRFRFDTLSRCSEKHSLSPTAAVGALMKVRLLKLKGLQLSRLLRCPLVKHSPWDVRSWRVRRGKKRNVRAKERRRKKKMEEGSLFFALKWNELLRGSLQSDRRWADSSFP